jgi:pantothenate kinase
MDVGGTLTKIVYFEANIGKRSNDPQKDPKSSTKEVPQPVLPKRTASLTHLNEPDHQEALEELYNIMDSTSKQRLNIPTRDESLSFYSTILGGRLHFLHFETRNMVLAINMLSSSGATENIRTIGCTGGGAHKYANQFEEQLGITFHPFDELGSLIRGMNFALTNVDEECYTYRREETQSQTQSQSDNGSNQASSPSTSSKDTPPPAVRKVGSFTAASLADKSAAGGSMSADSTPQRPSPAKKGFQQSAEIPTSPRAMEESKGSPRARDAKDYCHRVTMPHEMFSTRDYFPYLVVNIGSGVSIVKGEFVRMYVHPIQLRRSNPFLSGFVK